MQRMTVAVLLGAILVLPGCGFQRSKSSRSIEDFLGAPKSMEAPPAPTVSLPQTLSPANTHAFQAALIATERKIIRDAELRVDVDDPMESLRRVTAIAESNGGFVVTSESKRSDSESAWTPNLVVTVTVRVPSAKFGSTLDSIRSLALLVRQEKITGQDVTEEYMDLETRIRTKKALEGQYLEILKQAKKVTDVLEVQKHLAEVRTEIEQFEGRRRFLENRVNLSTIKVTLQTRVPVVKSSASGFLNGLKEAIGDGIDGALEVILVLIRLVLVLIPVVLFLVVPAWLLFKFLRRRLGKVKKPQPLPQ